MSFPRLASTPPGRAERDESAGWIPCASSNVHSFRWVGGDYPLQVRFLAKPGGGPGSVYEYDADFELYDDLFGAPSKGKFVWERLRKGGYACRRIS